MIWFQLKWINQQLKLLKNKWFKNYLGKYLLLLDLFLGRSSWVLGAGTTTSLQFEQKTLSSFLAISGAEIYFPQDVALLPRLVSVDNWLLFSSQIPKDRSSVEPQLEQVFPPKISYN